MGKFEDLTGRKFAMLTVLKRAGTDKQGNALWLCRCDCGRTTSTARSNELKSGIRKSCGCLRDERALNFGKSQTKHGKSSSRLYNIWSHMKSRCYDENNSRFKDYGGRGILICYEWRNDFQVFYEWSISNGYRKGLTIDRIDNNGNYEPANCRWASQIEQSNNRRTCRTITHKGETHTVREWALITGLNYGTLQTRIYRGWSAEKALTKGARHG